MRRVAILVSVVAALGLIAVGGVVVLAVMNREPLPIDDRCTATAGGNSTTLDPERAYYAALISGVSVKRGLVPRAASIALATAFQESGMRNLDYGHSDSIGLFQQRPSKGWGTVEEIMDPWYSSATFYKALVKVSEWETGDINDIAQAVQRSAHPEAYRKHVSKARTLASSLTGETPASFSCRVRDPGAADPDGMADLLTKTLGKTIAVAADGDGLVVTADNPQTAWSAAHLAIAGVARYGLDGVQVGGWAWTHDNTGLAGWHGSGATDTEARVLLSFAVE